MASQSVLIAASDRGIPLQLEPLLKSLGVVRCERSEDVRDAFDKLSSDDPFDFLVVDLQMEKSMAFTLIEFLARHAKPTLRSLPVIGTVGTVNPSEVNLLSEAGVTSFLTKPLAEKATEAKLREILGDYSNPDSERSFAKRCLATLGGGGDAVALLAAIDERISRFPRSVRLRLFRARALQECGRTTEAQEVLTQVIKALPENVTAMDLLGRIYCQQEKYDIGLRLLERAQQLSPLCIDRQLALGELLLASGRASVAENRFQLVLRRCPGLELATTGLARCLVEQGMVESVAELLADNATKERLVSHLNMKGVTLAKAGRYDEAIRMYQSAIRIVDSKPKKASLHYNIALAWVKSKDVEKAKASCKLALGQDPTNVKIKELLQRLSGSSPLPDTPESETEKKSAAGSVVYVMSPETRRRTLTGFLSDERPASARQHIIVYDNGRFQKG